MNITDIISSIQKGEFDNDMSRLSDVIVIRQKYLNTLKFYEFKPGDRIFINNRCSTTYLRGATGVVRSLRNSKILIDLDRPMRRFYKGVVVPTSIIDLIK